MTTTDAATDSARLRLELEHKDQLLASVYARADTLQAVVERLERQLDSAIEAQREAATERSELRRLLGNAQLQVHAMMRLPAPDSNGGAPDRDEVAPRMDLPQRPEVAGATPAASAPPRPRASTQPASSRPASSRPASSKPASSKPASSKPASSRPAGAGRPPIRQQSRGLVDEARGVFSNLRRMI